MTANNGTASQLAFETMMARSGKTCFVHRLTDAAEVRGRSTGTIVVKAQPADYIVTLDGVMMYAEVKSTVDPKVFKHSTIRKVQMFAARRQVSAGGHYAFFVHAIALDKWFCVPAEVILNSAKKSHRFEELKQYVFS